MSGCTLFKWLLQCNLSLGHAFCVCVGFLFSQQKESFFQDSLCKNKIFKRQQ